jgi:hypothetical protein
MFDSNSKVWVLGLFVAFIVLSWALFRNFMGPWIDAIDFNGACWSQSAHNTMRAGLLATAGVPSAFYFGPLPIPPSGYYTHHPPLLSLMLAGMFAVLGEKEWVARLLPIAFSPVGVVLLWTLMKDCAGRRNFSTHEWTQQTEGAADNTPVGRVVWLGKPAAKEILAALPPGSREEISVRGIPFCFWKPDR